MAEFASAVGIDMDKERENTNKSMVHNIIDVKYFSLPRFF